MNSGSVEKKPKPLLSVISGEYRLSVYPGVFNISIVIYKRNPNGKYDKLSKFVIPSDYLIVKILENKETREVLQKLMKLFKFEE